MAAKLQYVSELAGQTAREVTKNVDSWKRYLTTASRLYKYPFDEQLLIFAQRPDATACAEMELWNDKMRRWVRAGSKGIALIRQNGNGRSYLEYVFDIADTRPVRGAKTPWIWELREEHQETVLAALERQYGETAGTDFGSRLMELASRAAREIYQEHLAELSYGVEGSFLEGLDSLNLEVRYRDTLTASVQYALLSRCGLDPSAYLEDGDLRGITEFSTPAVLYQLGGAVSSLSQNLLLEVGRAIKAYDREHAAAQKKIREKEEKPLAKTEAIRYTKDTEKFNALKREIKEGSEQNGRAGIQESGSLSDSRPDVRWRERDGGTSPGQVRNAAGYVSERESQDDLYVLHASGDAASPSEGSRPEGAGRSGPDGSRNDEAGRRERGTESPRPDGLGTEGERPDRAGRGSGTGRDHLQVNQEIQTAGEEPAVFLSSEPAYQQFSLFPTPEEQLEAIVRAEEQEKAGRRVDRALSGAPEPVPKAVVGRTLTSGGNRPRSLERIVAFFQKNPTGSAAASFLEKEFGVGGKGLRIGGKEYALWFDKEGLRIAPGKSARIPGSMLVPWVDAAAQVSLLLWEGKFASQEVIDRARDNEFQELSEKLWYLRQNFSDEAKERGFLPTISALYGGFPDSTAKIKKELQGLPSRQAIVRELALFEDEYEKDGELLRFRPASAPRELLEEVNNLFLPPERFTADPDFSPTKGNFITQDEIDHTLCRGSGVSEGKLRIYSYFVQGHDAKECAAFLREEYGDGGHSYTGYDEWHDSKGIKLSRADDFSHPRDYDTVKLNWNQVQKRIRELMDSGRYLNSRELAYLPEYEKIQLAREIYAFQYYNPNDTERTYPHEWDFSAAEKSIRPLLDDAEKSAAFYRDMVKAMASVPTDHRHYQTMERALDKMAAFLRGEYSLFTPLPEAALQAERREKQESEKNARPEARESAGSDRRLEDAARALSKKQRRNIREQTDGQLSFDFAAMTLNHLEEQDEKEASKESESLSEQAQEVEPAGETDREPRYDLGYGYLGNGLAVWNRLEEENGDYRTIAHIAPNRTVTFYDQELPEAVREQIQKIAATSNLRISATQDAPVFSAPPARPEQTKQRPGQTRPERNYRTFARMFPEIVSGEYRYLSLQAGESMMPLSIQRIAEDQIAVAHTHIQNGDVMNDPEMTFRIDREAGTLEPLTFRQDGWPQIYQQVYPEPGRWIPKLSRDLSRFTEQWFKNIGEQGYYREQAIAERGGEDVTLRFDDEGNLLPEDAPASSVPPVKSPVTLYREALELLDREVKNSSLYSYLRDRDTDIDEAKDELDDALAHYMEEIGPENPELADAYLSLPMFREWLTEDLLERNYQDYSFDLRDSIDKNAGQPDTPEWAKEESRTPAVETAGRTDVSQRPETAPHGSLEPQNEGGEGMIPPQPEEGIQDTGAGGSGELNRPQDVQPEPNLAPNAEEYFNLKAQHPDQLVGIQTDGYLLFYGKDAQEAAAALGTKVLTRDIPGLGETDVTGYLESWQAALKKLLEHGKSTVIARPDPEYGPSAYLLFENALNQRDTRVYDTTYVDGKEVRTLNPKETAIAQQKQEAICEAFREWVFKDPQRRAELCAAYNKTFNSTRPREYDGSHIRFTGMNPEIKLEPHQRNAVARMLYGGNALLAHCVGAGKTFEMIAGAMEAKRLGLCQKSLFVVPNHLTEQWGGDFLTLYPGAKVLVATKRDFEPANRKKFCARIATGDYDAVIIGHSQFEKIPLSPARQEAAMKEQRDEIINAIAEAKAEKAERFTIKQLERTKKSLDTKIKRLYDKKRDDTITFEELGVDRLLVDEAHLFKNLYFHTKMQNVAGISQTEAQKSSDMFAKCRYLDEITGGRGVTFATGTPVSNSMVELYTMMRYLQLDMLKKRGMAHFDDWAANFGEKVTAVELKPEGTGFRAKTRFARFFNLPELMKLWKEATDIQTADMLKLPVPAVEYITVSTEPSEAQKQMVQDLAERAEAVRQGSVDPSVDNMLKITSDGRKLALDQRILNPLLGDDPNSKVNACVNNVFEIWKESAGTRGTQLIFSDLSTPKGKAERPPAKEGAEEPGDGNEQPEDAEALRLETSVYEDIRDKLVAKGFPREEIAFIHEANTEAQKAELFAKVRNGQIRVLLGSTQKMGAGTNVQKRLIASHDLDCPWRPADLEQRAGRILRRGNDNPKVKIFRYVTKGTFDAYNWGLVENKQKFIGQIMTSKSPARSIEDVDATALSYAEVKMIATGDPRIKEKMDLDIQVSKLKMLKSNHMAQKYEMEDKVVGYYPQKIAETRLFIEALSADLPILQSHPAKDDAFSITIQGKVYTERKEAGEALVAACQSIKDPEKPIELGEYRGFPMKLRFENGTFKVTMKQHLTYTAELSTDVVGNITRINNALEKIPENLVRNRKRLENLQTELASAKEEAARPFPQEEELEQKSARLSQLNKELDNEEKQPKTEPAREEENEQEAPAGKPSILKALKQFDRPAPAASGPAKETRREAVL